MRSPADSPRLLRLRVAFKLALGVAAVVVALVALGYLGGGGRGGPAGARFEVADLAPGEARRLDWAGRPLIVLRREGPGAGWFVAIANGTAMGCPVVWQRDRGHFVETCSGARYDAGGQPTGDSGLAPLKTPPHYFDTAGRLVVGRE